MITYLVKNGNKYIYFGYKDYVEGLGNYTGLKNEIATVHGYIEKGTEGDIKTVIPNCYFSGVSSDINKVLSAIKSLGEVEHLIVAGTNQFAFYLIHGESHDGVKDSLFKDSEYIKLLRSKSVSSNKGDTVDKLVSELTTIEEGDWVFEDKKYWDPKVTKPTMLTGKKIVYFPNLSKYNDKHLYLTTNVKETDELGKQINSINYTMIIGNEIPEVTELINLLDLRLNQPIVIKSDILFGKDNIRVRKYGKIYTKRFAGVIELKYPNDDVVALHYSPSGMMMVMRDDLTSVLKIFEQDMSVDITSKIYDGDSKVIHIDSKFSIDVDVCEDKIKIISSVDTLDRNHFKRIEKLKPTVSLLYYNRLNVMKYFTVIKTEDDTVISYAPFNNIRYQKPKVKKI